jgi:hypothetical protein
MRTWSLPAATAAAALAGTAVHAEPLPAGLHKAKPSWVMQVGLSHSPDDRNHWAVSGFHGRFPVFALDRTHKSDRLGGFGIEVGLYPYPVISRAYVPGADVDPETPGKFNFWEAGGVSYYSPRFGPLQLEAGARLAFINRADRVLTSPNGCGVGNREEPRCNAYIKEALKTLDTIFFPSFNGSRGVVTFAAAALTVRNIGVRVEFAQLGAGPIDARGLRFGLTAR